MDSDPSASDEKPIVLLIHGTFAYQEATRGKAWWQIGSDFQKWFAEQDAGRLSVQPEPEIFRWTGNNSERDRRTAAKRLAAKIDEYEEQRRQYLFVAHSHGGSVLFDALTEANTRRPGLPGLVRWVTVGTPFLRYTADPSVWWLMLPIATLVMACATIAALQVRVLQANWIEFLIQPEPVEIGGVMGIDAALFALLFVISAYLGRSTLAQLRERRLERDRVATFVALQARHASLLCSEDEAVAGLGSTLAFTGPLMMRPRHWWAALYTSLLAPIGDQFIWRQLARRAQGNDLAGLRLRAVLRTPMLGVVPAGFSAGTAAQVVSAADGRLTSVAGSLRRSLYGVAFEAQPIEYLRQAAIQAGVVESLIHTSYFDGSAVRHEIVSAINGEPHNSNLPAQLELPARVVRYQLLAASGSIAACLLVVFLAVMLRSLLVPLDPQVMVATAIRASPFVAATYADPQEPYELLYALAKNGYGALARETTDGLQQPDDRLLAEAFIAMGLASGSLPVTATEPLRELAARPILPPTLAKGIAGPLPPGPTLGHQAVGRALGLAGLSEEAERYVGRFDLDSAQQSLAVEVATGIIEGRHWALVAPWLKVVSDTYERERLLDRALLGNCRLHPLLVDLPPTPETVASLLLAQARCGEFEQPETSLAKIDDATARVRAGTELARIVAAQGKHELAARLLRRERADFPSFRRHPLEGLAIHHVRYAHAFADIGLLEEARAVMIQIENVRGEPYENQTAVDNSAPDRAILWARLGESRRAVRWWNELPEGMGSVDEKLDLLSEISSSLAALGAELPQRADYDLLQRPDADRWYHIVSWFFALGNADGRREQLSTFRRARVLQQLQSSLERIDDPHQKSRGHAAVAMRFLNEGVPRIGLTNAERALPAHQMRALAKAVEFYPLTR